MKSLLVLLLSLGTAHAGKALDAGKSLDYVDARHLLARSGFSPSDAEVRAYVGMSRADAAAKLLAGVRTVANEPTPAWAEGPIDLRGGLKDAPPAVKHAVRGELIQRGLELRAWWYREMLTTSSPLTEKMVLFWHGHFVSSQNKVRSNILMYRQNVLFRKMATGNFRTLLHEVARDPAMLVYLDGANSRKEQPNENFAREVMELFTLGEGHYAEQDIKEAARAFTGWSVERLTGAYRYRPFFHDGGEKLIFGQRGNFDGDAVLDLLLEQPNSAPFLVRKLWRAFVSPKPDEVEVTRLAKLLRDSSWEMAPVLRALFSSDAFYRASNRGALVKSPTELIVGVMRQLHVSPPDLRDVAIVAASLGEDLFRPANVKGWPGGEAWIDANSLLGRKQLLSRALPDAETHGLLSVDAPAFLRSIGGDVHTLERLLLPVAPHHALPPDATASIALRALVLDPVFQLQ